MESPDQPSALVTGTNRGTGRAIAVELDRLGYHVISINRTEADHGLGTEYLCDLAVHDELVEVAARIAADHDVIDAVVPNAVVRKVGRIENYGFQDWYDSVAVNLTAVVFLIQATLPAVRAARGRYVVIGSHAASRFFEGGVAYSATKAALKAVVETLLLEERAYGVSATLVSPGAIANRADDESPYKMTTTSIASWVGALIQHQTRDLVVGEVEIRPALLAAATAEGLDRLQHV